MLKYGYASEMGYFFHRRMKDGEPLPLHACLHTQKRRRKPRGYYVGKCSSSMTDHGGNIKCTEQTDDKWSCRCEGCDKHFTDFSRHMRIHTGECLHRYEVVGKQFNETGSLKAQNGDPHR